MTIGEPSPALIDREGEEEQVQWLGRRYAPDPRDKRYELTPKRMAKIPVAPAKERKLPWRMGPILDQGPTPRCTVFALAHFLQAAPRVHLLGWSDEEYTTRYKAAQDVDEWPGNDYDGTSERAVLKGAQDRGEIAEYLMVPDEDTAKEYVRTRGGLLAGMDWYPPMFRPGKHGYVEPSGFPIGGHELYVRWYYPKTHYKYPDTWELPNSWSPEWGDRGVCRMKGDVFRYLVFQTGGDLFSAIESPVVRRKAA